MCLYVKRTGARNNVPESNGGQVCAVAVLVITGVYVVSNVQGCVRVLVYVYICAWGWGSSS